MESLKKCRHLVDALAEDDRGFPTLEYTETSKWARILFERHEDKQDESRKVALIRFMAAQVSSDIDFILGPDNGNVQDSQAICRHLSATGEEIERVEQTIHDLGRSTSPTSEPDPGDLRLYAKHRGAEQEQFWLVHARVACNALTYLYRNMGEHRAAVILKKSPDPGYACTLELLQRFHTYCWICLTRGGGDWSGIRRPEKELCLQGNKLEDMPIWSDQVNPPDTELDDIWKEWESGSTLGEIIKRLPSRPIV